MSIRPGRPYPLGATWDGAGTNFALFSEHASAVELCLFDEAGTETHRINLRERTAGVWHGYIEVGPGQHYGYRVHGPFAPSQGHRFNPHKLLLDPYAKAFSGPVTFHKLIWQTLPKQRRGRHPYDTSDTANCVPKCIVVDPRFDWQGDEHLRRPWNETVIYECHVKGTSVRHPEVPDELRGTYRGLCCPPVVQHLKRLGVTAVELLPVHQIATESHLLERGLSNYWGYSSIGFFAPDVRFAAGPASAAVSDFKTMVRELHKAGIEVLLDVVYNHTAEGGSDGPTLCFRGIDNSAYYVIDSHDRSRYRDATGCGNTLNFGHPRVVQMVMDSLRYWVAEMHVDGFRFDLAPVHGREPLDYDRRASFFTAVAQDPVLAGTKLIAEPWDIGQNGYQVGNFPPEWAEWNDKFRDTTRRFWRGDGGQVPELASRVSGSSDLFVGRGPWASINFVTAHDGFTLHDLVSYNQKHNEKNGENNRDGSDNNTSQNFGVEGPTDDEEIIALRELTKRNFLATLLLSQGVPMLTAGDEMGKTQDGNNNAYCQDNPVSWLDWSLTNRNQALLNFAREVLALRRALPVLRRRSFLTGKTLATQGGKDITWLHPAGRELTQADWREPNLRTIGMLLLGRASDAITPEGEHLASDSVLIWLNGDIEPHTCQMPGKGEGKLWTERLRTTGSPRGLITGKSLEVAARSVVVLTREG